MEGNGVNKLILTTLCALVLVGCGDSKQQKLEACMKHAESLFHYDRDTAYSQAGCDTRGMSPKMCADALARSAQERIQSEERCVKLYK